MVKPLLLTPLRSMLPTVLAVSIVLLAFASSACIARHPAGIAPSTSPLPPSFTVLGPVAASSCKWVVLLFPISGKSSIDKMIEQLIAEQGATALIGVTVEHKIAQYPFVGSDCSIVKGVAVRGVSS
ncbi:MAG: hypothetical protein ABL983_03040 [Nitrospira sp.]